MRKYFDWTEDTSTGKALANVVVKLLTAPTSEGGSLVTMYSDNGSTPISGDLTTDADGYFEFYCADGTYAVEWWLNGSVIKSVSGVQIYDNAQFSAAIDALGASGGDNLGSFTGGIIEDDSTVKEALQALESAIENETLLRESSDFNIANLSRQYPPFLAVADVPVGDLIPTSTYPLAAVRLHAEWIMVRTRTADLDAGSADGIYWDEYILRDPAGYADVPGGWQEVAHRVYLNGRYTAWMVAPDDQGGIPNPEFAIRLGNFAETYHSGGEGPSFYFAGFGHGNMHVTSANIQVTLNGGGTNLQTVANWPVGTRKYGSTFEISSPFKLRARTGNLGNNPVATTSGSGTITVSHTAHGYSTGQYVKLGNAPLAGINGITYAQLIARQQVTVLDANSYTMATGGSASSTGSGGGLGEDTTSGISVFADVVDLTYTQTFGTYGMRRKGAYAFTLAGYAIQDSYGYMFPLSPYGVTHYKPEGLAAVAITGDGTQKGNWTTGTSQRHQAYNSAQPQLVCSVDMEYGQPLRKALGGLSAWGQNLYGRFFFRDLEDFPKYYIFINSSEESMPRTAWQGTVGEVLEWQSTKRTRWLVNGAA